MSSCRCVLELHAILSKIEDSGGEFAVAMTEEEKDRFLREISSNDVNAGSGVDGYYQMLGTVNAEQSDCSRTVDRESIHGSIRQSIGFEKLGRQLFCAFEKWMEEQLRAQVALNVSAGDAVGSMKWNGILATVFGKQGRHEDALALQLQVLNVFQRDLPPDDSDLSEFFVLLKE
jgi:hypothetical protein